VRLPFGGPAVLRQLPWTVAPRGADHFVPHNDLVKETLAWLDPYLGPVK
jgi:hypothetical protein